MSVDELTVLSFADSKISVIHFTAAKCKRSLVAWPIVNSLLFDNNIYIRPKKHLFIVQ
jgi:hypothetical protein